MTQVGPSDAVTLKDLRDDRSESWAMAYEELWRVGWMTAKGKLPYDSAEQIEDLVAQVISKEIVPQILSPRQEAFVKATRFEDILEAIQITNY